MGIALRIDSIHVIMVIKSEKKPWRENHEPEKIF